MLPQDRFPGRAHIRPCLKFSNPVKIHSFAKRINDGFGFGGALAAERRDIPAAASAG
jgi:hypothetical protein